MEPPVEDHAGVDSHWNPSPYHLERWPGGGAHAQLLAIPISHLVRVRVKALQITSIPGLLHIHWYASRSATPPIIYSGITQLRVGSTALEIGGTHPLCLTPP